MANDVPPRHVGLVSVVAGDIAIGKADWYAISRAEATEERAAALMRGHSFDVIPILANGSVFEYFATTQPDAYSSVSRRAMKLGDVLPIQTPVRDLIHLLAVQQRHFYFLLGSGSIEGIVTVGDLNRREVYVYLFAMLSEVEILLGQLISVRRSNEELIAMLRSPMPTEEARKTLERYEKDKSSRVDTQVVAYLSLSQLKNIGKRLGIHDDLEYTKGRFDTLLNAAIHLRQPVAHPIREIVGKDTPVTKLGTRIERVEELLSRLREVSTSGSG